MVLSWNKMPYIPKETRAEFDNHIDSLAELLAANFEPGALNYCISRLIWKLFRKKPSYTLGNNLIGVLECVKAEFYRRMLAPYEDSKISQNGDLDI